jgi:hypothetical protein
MKTFQEFINEENFTTLKDPFSRGKTFDVYKNPSSSDLSKLMKESVELKRLGMGDGKGELRFILDSKTKICYVWLALHTTHLNALNQMKSSGAISDVPPKGVRDYFRFFTAEADIRGGDMVYDKSDIWGGLLGWLPSAWSGSYATLPGKVHQPDWLPTEFPPAMLKKMCENPQELVSLFSFGSKWISGFQENSPILKFANIVSKK